MIVKTRVGVYETNSSSMHSLTFYGGADIDKVCSDKTETIVLGTGEYGWGYETLSSPLEKMDYLSIETENSEDKKELLLEAIARVYPNVTIEFNYTGYIDHQSYGEIWEGLKSVDDLVDVIWGNAEIIIDNDNR